MFEHICLIFNALRHGLNTVLAIFICYLLNFLTNYLLLERSTAWQSDVTLKLDHVRI
jgi:hypothetical protein